MFPGSPFLHECTGGGGRLRFEIGEENFTVVAFAERILNWAQTVDPALKTRSIEWHEHFERVAEMLGSEPEFVEGRRRGSAIEFAPGGEITRHQFGKFSSRVNRGRPEWLPVEITPLHNRKLAFHRAE